MSSTSSTTGSKHYVVPFVASMDASGAATFEYVQQETVSIAGIKYFFDRTINEVSSINTLNCFTVSGNGPADGFNVTLSDPAAMHSLLMSIINGNAIRGGSNTLRQQLIADLHAGLQAAIGADALVNTVENLDVNDVDVTIDSSGGASNMIAGLTDAKCDLIYTQIPKAALNLYMDASENQTTSALPLQKGDVLTFVFDVNVSDVEPVKSQVNTGETGAANGGGNVSGEYTSTLHYDLPSVRIAIDLKLSGESGAYTGLKA